VVLNEFGMRSSRVPRAAFAIRTTDMQDKRYPLPPVYAYLTFWLSVAGGVATFFG